MRSFTTLLLALSLPLYALAAHTPSRRHNGLALRARGDLLPRQNYDNARCTFYDVTTGITACGGTFQPGDFIVALDVALFGSSYPSPYCFRALEITYNGKTARATIQDACPGCPYGGLDMTEGLFQFFAPESVGVFYASWHFVDGSNSGNTPASSPDTTSSTPQDTPTYVAPSPTSTPTPTPTPDYTPTTSSTPPPPPTTSSTTTSYPEPPPTTSTTPTTSSSPTTSYPPPSSTPSPSPSPTTTDGTNLAGLNDVVNNFANLVEDCGDE